jgi:hypothetical protein
MVGKGRSNVEGITEVDSRDILLPVLVLLTLYVLSWRFEETPLLSTLTITFKDFIGTHNVITPGENWRDLLVKGGNLLLVRS